MAKVVVIQTHGALLDLSARALVEYETAKVMLPELGITTMQLDKVVDRNALLIQSYKDHMLETTGLDIWMPEPIVHTIQTNDPHNRVYFWIHAGKSNQHRKKYAYEYRHIVRPIQKLMDNLDSPHEVDSLRRVMDKVNQTMSE